MKANRTNDSDGVESIDTLDERDRRALEQYLTVLPDAADLYRVVSESGSEYVVDVQGGHCTCPDHEYREVECKHLRRVAFATGERPLPAGVDRDDLSSDFAAHVDGEPVGPVAADGGTVEAPLPPITTHREPVEQGGAKYWRCQGCDRETIYGREKIPHTGDCPRAEEVRLP